MAENVREAVLADIAAGLSQREAAKKHGANPNTVFSWCKRAGVKAPAPRQAQATPKARGKASRDSRSSVDEKVGIRTAVAQARATAAIEALPDSDRSRIRQFRDHVLELLADRDFIRDDPKGASALMRGFKDLVTGIPEILAIDERVGVRKDDGQALDEVATALGAEPRPALKVVPGGG